jgi:hypothetical protein
MSWNVYCDWVRAMQSRMRRLGSDALISGGVVIAVLIILLSVDVRVREQVRTVLGTTSSVQAAGSRVGEVGTVLFEAARTQSLDHAPMMIFVVAATVLVLFMVRS